VDAIRDCIADARRRALAVRPSISSEVFEQLNVLHWTAQREGPQLHDWLVGIELGAHLVTGLAEDSMSHDEAWDFMRLGRYLERASNVTRLVERKRAEITDDDPLLWAAVLRCCWAFEAYRGRYSAPVTSERAAEFLLLDRSFPRSAGFCCRQGLDSVRRIDAAGTTSVPHRALGRLVNLFDDSDPAQVTAGFANLFDAVQRALANTYFRPSRELRLMPVPFLQAGQQ
jgi:uncharacterized alpha-E superfamily protein